MNEIGRRGGYMSLGPPLRIHQCYGHIHVHKPNVFASQDLILILYEISSRLFYSSLGLFRMVANQMITR